MIKCSACKKEQDSSVFKQDDKTFKKCLTCRETAQKWRAANKERVAKYNKLSVDKRQNEKETVTVVYAKKVNDEEWTKYDSQRDAALKLNLQAPNINKVVKGTLKSTGGYNFKIEEETKEKKELQTWTEIKKEENYEEKCKGQPSQHRTHHETIDNVEGKKCCTCKEWKSLEEYNHDENHWDKLRVECKSCMVKYRKDNRRNIQDTMNIYERNRRKTDPDFKLMKTLRTRLGRALKTQDAEKRLKTLDLTGCSVDFLWGWLTSKFKPGMTRENQGEWHVDHVIPCDAWNLKDDEELKMCFNYRNLQPMWGAENLRKSAKYLEEDKQKYIESYRAGINPPVAIAFQSKILHSKCV